MDYRLECMPPKSLTQFRENHPSTGLFIFFFRLLGLSIKLNFNTPSAYYSILMFALFFNFSAHSPRDHNGPHHDNTYQQCSGVILCFLYVFASLVEYACVSFEVNRRVKRGLEIPVVQTESDDGKVLYFALFAI